MTVTTKQRIKSETAIWIQYFVISLLAAIWAYDRYTRQIYGPAVAGIDENLLGMLRKMIYLFLEPWSFAFVLLSASRLISILLVDKLKSR